MGLLMGLLARHIISQLDKMKTLNKALWTGLIIFSGVLYESPLRVGGVLTGRSYLRHLP